MRWRLLMVVTVGIMAAAAATPPALAVTPGAELDQSQDVTEGCLHVHFWDDGRPGVHGGCLGAAQ